MVTNLKIERKLTEDRIFNGTFPGVYDFDQLIDADADGYDTDGRLLFKFRKGIVPVRINDNFPNLANYCLKKRSLRIDAAGPQYYEESRLLGYDLNKRTNNCVAETQFTKDKHDEFKKSIYILEFINDLYKAEFPSAYYLQKSLKIDPHFLIGRTVFSQCIINKSFRTCLHRDKGNVEGTMSNLICLGDESYSGGYLVFPEYKIAIKLRPRDYLGFLGQEMWHGNTEIKGPGMRLSMICYARNNILGKTYDEELFKHFTKIKRKFDGNSNS